MQLICHSYADAGTIELLFVHHSVPGGGNRSPRFTWSGVPGAAASLALVLVDPHPVVGNPHQVACNRVHWIVTDLPPTAAGLVEGASAGGGLPGRAIQLINGFGESGYGGPAPPPGSGRHPYVATLYALDVQRLGILPAASLTEFHNALRDRVLDRASVTGYCERELA